MEVQATGNSPLYLFEKFEVGVIHLDAERNVVAMNDFARKVLPVGEKQPFDKLVTSFHPERSKPKVNFLLDQASGCPVASSTPMASAYRPAIWSCVRKPGRPVVSGSPPWRGSFGSCQ